MGGARTTAGGGRRRGLGRWWVLVLLVVVGLFYGRALLESKAALEEGDRLADSDPEGAMTAWRHAVEWHAPGNPWASEAVDRLLAIGLGPPADEGGEARSLYALESLRTAILVTRGLTTPFSDKLEAVEDRIAELRGAEAAARTRAPIDDEVARQRRLLRESRERAPDPGWSLFTTLAFVAWIGVTWRGLGRAFDDEGRLRRRRALVYAGASALALGAWIAGLTLV